ncbi:MAG TPA: outer membrane beta-barrel protein [Caulobacter sp.]|nr:outer membrane beta-barrel protein [Caulobacter sp.]
MRKFILMAGAATALVGAPAMAQDGGAYVSVSAGLASVKDTELRYYDAGGTFGGVGATDSVQTSVEMKNAAAFAGTAGYDFGVVRAELEIGYNRNELEAITVKSVNGAPVTLTPADVADVCLYLDIGGCTATGNRIAFSDGGRMRQLSAMANLWFDIPVSDRVTPYVGGGAGLLGFEADGEGDATFAWQLGAGVAFQASPNLAITADYRYRSADGKDIAYDSVSGFEIGRMKTSILSAGLRYSF